MGAIVGRTRKDGSKAFIAQIVIKKGGAIVHREAQLVRAADLIGQLGDPHYLRKANALYYKFEEVGMNKQLGYDSPADLTDQYPKFFWGSISPFIQGAIRYLSVTSSGRQWIANLYGNVLRAERELSLYGPRC